MKTISLAIALFGASTVCFAGNLKSEIDAMNKIMHQLMMKKDIKSIEKFLTANVTKDFVYTEEGRKMNLKQMLDQMKFGFGQMEKIVSIKSAVSAVKESGNNGSCATTHVMVVMMKGPDKKSHRMDMTGLSKETFKKFNGKWLISSMNWTNEKMLMDGKPFDPSKMGGAPK